MAAKLTHIQSDNGKFLTDQVNRTIRNFETSQVTVQIITTTVPDQRNVAGSKVIYEAFITHPA
ncbi:hypothetical protein [Pseudarthrobacter oxydans]|uniref:hypothetical protein n=1 Tax=Pseudarthrobacter oxydans TaxID=1671 RepID=UPI0035EC815C|nr:hypothetical protein GCM10017547_38470 [Pseudarthrobacter oxydans]